MKKEFNPEIFHKLFPQNGIISEEEINLMKMNGKNIFYKKKDVIFKQDTFTSHAMFINSGLVKLYKEGRSNKSFILKLATPGHFLGMISIFGGGTFQYSASAIEDTEIFFVDINIFNSIIEKNGQYALHLLKTLSADNLYMFERIISQFQKQLPGKIADIILYFSEIIYQSTSFEFPLTRTELAEIAGTTKESLIRTLSEFKNHKIIDLDGKNVKITSMEIVKTLSKIG